MTADKSMCMCFPWWMCSSMQITPVQWDCWVFCTKMEIASWPQPTNEAKGWLDVYNTVYMPYCQICRHENVTHWPYAHDIWPRAANWTFGTFLMYSTKTVAMWTARNENVEQCPYDHHTYEDSCNHICQWLTMWPQRCLHLTQSS